MKKLWQNAIVSEHYDVVAQFIGYTAEDVKRDIRLFQNKSAAIYLYQQCLCLPKGHWPITA